MEQKNAINCYTCEKCGNQHWTVNLNDGVTPMFIRCRNGVPGERCSGMAVSAGYRVAQDSIPEWGWYRPDERELKRLKKNDPDTFNHVEMGGLLLRKLDAIEMERYGMRYRRA